MKIKIQHKKERSSMAKLSSTSSSMKQSMIMLTKQQSKHVKTGSNVSALAEQNNLATKKSTKQKKAESEKQKTIRHSEFGTSGRNKELKFKIKNKKSCHFQTDNYYVHQNIESVTQNCDEYCLVEGSFVPIVSKTQHQKLEDIMRSTADTTKRIDELGKFTLKKMFPFQLKKSQKTVSKNDSESEQSVFVRSKKVSKKQVEVDASPFYTEIGIQYSERPNFFKPIMEAIKQKKSMQVDIQTEDFQVCPVTITPIKQLDEMQISEPIETQQLSISAQNKQPADAYAIKKQQTLSDLLLKLEFKHLPNETSFNTLSKTQKQHYTDLLSSLISKLNCSPRQKSPRQIKSKKQIEFEEVKLIPIEQIKIKHEKLQMEVFKRESIQMNWIQRRIERNLQKNDDDVIDTSLMAVNNFLLNFFCYIELNYMEDFLNSIKRQYGPSYIAQFQRVTRKLKKSSFQSYKVLQQHSFQQFTDQLSDSSPYERIHLKAIFDYTNELLDCYRPYYQHQGEPFPWAVKIYNNICEYVIDENSLEIIFVEIKQNLQKSVSMLCGLIVEDKFYKDISGTNPLTAKRTQKQNMMIESWLNEKSDQNHDIECEATQVLNKVSEDIYSRLMLQIFQEMKCIS